MALDCIGKVHNGGLKITDVSAGCVTTSDSFPDHNVSVARTRQKRQSRVRANDVFVNFAYKISSHFGQNVPHCVLESPLTSFVAKMPTTNPTFVERRRFDMVIGETPLKKHTKGKADCHTLEDNAMPLKINTNLRTSRRSLCLSRSFCCQAQNRSTQCPPPHLSSMWHDRSLCCHSKRVCCRCTVDRHRTVPRGHSEPSTQDRRTPLYSSPRPWYSCRHICR